MSFPEKSRHPYSKMCELCELYELFVGKSHRFRDGIIYFSSVEFIRWPSTLGTREALLERPQGYGTASGPQGSCGPCIVCWQDGINPYIISVLLSPGTREALLERPPAYWNARRATGTREALLEPPYRAAGPLGPFAL